METPNKIEIIEDYVDDTFFDKMSSIIPYKQKTNSHRNQVLRWGSKDPYPDNFVSEEIPDIFNSFKDKFKFNSITINEYYANQYIGWHKDMPNDSTPVIVLSLLSDAVLNFRKDDRLLSFMIPKNSLTIFSDELKNEWDHSLTAKNKRYSIVFRNSDGGS